jgi:tRNA G10  N-methylase Trm11
MIYQTKKNWFLLGGFPLISAAEISAVLELNENEILIDQNFLFCDKKINKADKLIKRLGGTVKIAVFTDTANSEEELSQKLINLLTKTNGKIIFGISAYFGVPRETSQWVYALGKTIKKELKNKSLSCRYVFNREAFLSSVTVKKNNLIEKGFEFLIIKKDNKYFFARTVAIQPFEEWGRRDFDRPGRDDLSGMLPPKLARIMINLSSNDLNSLLLDPFCGSGTIITEAMSLGYNNIIGSDLSLKAVSDTEKNIRWLKNINPETSRYNIKLLTSDVLNLTDKLAKNSIDLIVTEPYLGKPLKGKENEKFLRDQMDDLKKLYTSAFSIFKKILKKNGTIIFIFPCFKFNQQWLRINCQKEIKQLGFVAEPFIKNNEFLLYARSSQKIGREIWKYSITAS